MKSANNEKSIGQIISESLTEVCYFLAILFCALRACGVISWNWIWVMSPIFFSWVISVLILAIAGIITLAVIDRMDEDE